MPLGAAIFVRHGAPVICGQRIRNLSSHLTQVYLPLGALSFSCLSGLSGTADFERSKLNSGAIFFAQGAARKYGAE